MTDSTDNIDNTERFALAAEMQASGRHADAAALYRRILDSQPAHLAAAKALADIVESGLAAGDAAAARRKAWRIEAESAYKVARTAHQAGSYDVARRCYLKVLDLDPEHDDAIWGLAEASYGCDRPDEALRWYRAYLERHPRDPEAAHMVAALGGGPAPVRASDAYVRDTFDHFAEDFDRQLLEDLDYRAPKLILDLFRRAFPDAARDGNLDILDLGCGTGLAGIEFRPLARRLVGVDLSPEMLKLAGKRGLYDELVEGELAASCRARPGAFDAAVAADVLCYIGDLSESLDAAAAALRDGGRLVFSVEALAGGGDGYELTASGRYAHAPAYVRGVARAAGFEEVSAVEETLRTEYGAPVAGYVTALRKVS